jgi:hypothetical protein
MHDSKNLEEKQKKKKLNSTLAKELNFHGKRRPKFSKFCEEKKIRNHSISNDKLQ